MAYTPPVGSAVNFDLGSSYVPPGGAAVNFDLESSGNNVVGATLGSQLTFGTTVFVQTLGAEPTGFDSSVLGTPGIDWAIRTIYTPAIDLSPFQVGEPASVVNAAQRFFAGGVYAPGYGTPTIENLLKFIDPNPIGPKAFGSTDVSHFLRYIDPPPIGPRGVGSPDVEFKDREIGPATGIPPRGFGNQLVWREQYITPIPWESSVVQPPEELLNNVRRSHIQGFSAALYGTAVVYNAQEYIFPGGWNSEEFYNLDSELRTNFIRAGAFMGANTPPDLYGNALIENINRRVQPYGYPQQKFGYTYVANNAEPFYPASIVREGYGTPVVDYVNRERVLEGWESSVFSPYAALHNAAKAVYPAGINDGDLGQLAYIENLNRTVWAHTPPEPPPITGVFVAYAIRYLEAYGIQPPPDAFPTVRRNPEYLRPVGFETYATGWQEVITRFNEIRPSSVNVPSVVRVGEPYIHSRNRELRGYGLDHAEYGVAFVENSIRDVGPAGDIREDVFGLGVIMFRTRTMRANAIPAPRISVRHRFNNQIPDPPGPSFIFPDGTRFTAFGTPWLPRNRIEAAGDIGPKGFGVPTLRPNSIYPPVGFDHDDLIGRPQVYLYRGRITGAGGISSELTFGLPRFDPRYLRARQWPRDNEGVAQDPARYGTAYVTTPHTKYAYPQDFVVSVVGVPRVQLKKRFVRPAGIRSLRIGFARFLNVPQFVDVTTYDIPPGSVGRPTVARPVIPYTGPYTAAPSGVSSERFGTTDVELQNRPVYPDGFLATRYGTGMVGTTRWRSVVGFATDRYGTLRIEYLHREVEPEGEVETVFNDEDSLGYFDYRAVVTRRAQTGSGAATVEGIGPGGFGALGITMGARTIAPLGINASGVPRPRVSQPRAVAVAGWGGEVFGRADHWTPGQLIPYSIDPVGFGVALLTQGVFPQGIDAGSIMGTASATRAIRVWGFPPVGFDGPLLYDDQGRNLRFVAPLPIIPGKVSRPEVTT